MVPETPLTNQVREGEGVIVKNAFFTPFLINLRNIIESAICMNLFLTQEALQCHSEEA